MNVCLNTVTLCHFIGFSEAGEKAQRLRVPAALAEKSSGPTTYAR